MEERTLTEELIGYDTSNPEGIRLCAGFVKGWLESRDIVARQIGVRDLPVTIAEVGPEDASQTLLLHGHVDVVPGRPEQFQPRVEGDRLHGRGAYDMKGALAGLLLALADLREQDQVRVRLGIVPDEESEEEDDRGGDRLVEAGFVGDFAITGEPTDMQRGRRGQGRARDADPGQGRAAHGATPWLGENAILRAYEVFREIESLPFAGQSSELFDRPSINLGRILGGDALNKVPDTCFIDVDVRYLPEQDPTAILARGSRAVRRARDLDLLAAARRGRPGLRPTCRPCGPSAAPQHRRPGRGASSAATAPPTPSRSCAPASRRWSSGPWAAATTAPTSGSRSPRWRGYRRSIVDFVHALPSVLAPRQATSSRRPTVDRRRGSDKPEPGDPDA